MKEKHSEEINGDIQVDEKVPVLLSKRWILSYISMLGFCMLYSLRVNLSVAIICMVRSSSNYNNSSSISSNTTESSCGFLESNGDDGNMGEFTWGKSTQSIVLSAFFYGYIVTQLPGGWVAGRFGGKLVFGGGMVLTSLATIALPVSARWDYRSVIALRILMGIFQGVAYPCMHSMWGRWAPPQERTKLMSFSYTGSNLGNIITFAVAGILCAEGFDHGWGSIFYITGGAGLLWSVGWFYLVSNSPDTHPTITKAEKNYILQSLGNTSPKKFEVPWRSLLTSRSLWVILVSHVCNNWMHYTLLTGLPTFMKEVLKFDIKENGVLSAVPYIVMAVTVVCAGQLADYLRSKWLSTTSTRKLFQTLSFLCSGALIVGVGFVSCEHRVLAVILLAVAVGFEGLSYAGFMVNPVDFAPRYAGIIIGITNMVSTVPGILAPIAVGALTPNKTQEEWRNVFFVCGAFTLVGAVVFAAFARGETESWAVQDWEESESEPPVAADGRGSNINQGKVNNGFHVDQEDTDTDSGFSNGVIESRL